jgi:hypothetical protein
MIRASHQFVVLAAVAAMVLMLAPTSSAEDIEIKGMEVNMSCDREAYTRKHCAMPAYEGTEKTADELMLETFKSCAGGATKGWFSRDFFPLDVNAGRRADDLAASSPEDVVDDHHGSLRNLGYEERNLGVCGCVSCRSLCCLLGYCVGTCGCGCSCDGRRLGEEEEEMKRGSHSKFIELMEGVMVKTAQVEESLASSCTSAVQKLAEKMEASGNMCMGTSTKIQCYATAFT